MLESYVIFIPEIPPSTNQLYSGGVRTGRRYLSAAGRTFKDFVILHIRSNYKNIKINSKKISLTIEIHKKWLSKEGKNLEHDISNRIKVLEDAVFEAIGVDDSIVWDLRIIKAHSETIRQSVLIIKELY